MADDGLTAAEIRARNRATLDQYLGRAVTGEPVIFDGKPESLTYVSEDHWVQVPFSPEGQFKIMHRGDMAGMFEWIEKSFPSPYLYTTVITHATEDPKVFWIEDDGLGMTTWRGGFVYANRHVVKYVFDEAGKVRFECEYFNPIAKFRTDLTEIPEWDYNAERARVGLEPVRLPTKGRTHSYPLLAQPAEQPPMSEEAHRRARALMDRFTVDDRFVEGGFDSSGRWVPDPEVAAGLADDFCFELPWSPDGMLKLYSRDERVAFSQFLAKSVKDLRIIKKYFWETTDPAVFIWEDEREATVTWRGGGAYHNRHVGVVMFDSEGKLLRWCEYFNPAQMFTMDGTKWPEWSYDEERARVGLPPAVLEWGQTHGLPALD